MSLDALSWAFHLEVEAPATKLTLMALANYANEYGIAYPSQKTLSRRTALSPRAVRNHMIILEKAGFITITERKRPNGASSSNVFKLNIGTGIDQRIAEKAATTPHARPAPPLKDIAATPLASDAPPPASGASPPRIPCIPDPAPDAPQESSLLTVKGTVTESIPGEEPEDGLPHGIRKEAWDGFLEVRRKLGKDPTQRAIRLLFKALGEFKAEGQDVNAILEQSTVQEWAGVFPIKSSGQQPPPRQQQRYGRPEKFDPTAYVNRNAARRPERDVTDV